MVTYPIVQVKTPDNLWLYGLFLEAQNSEAIFVHTHGTGSNFYEEYFIEVFAKKFLPNNTSILSVNNRGAYIYDSYQKSGAAVEKFEDCLIDFDTWIEFALKRGYETIILSGHSLGTEKAVYYLNKGKYKDKIKAVALLAPADSYGYHLFAGGQPSHLDQGRVKELLDEAKRLVAGGQGEAFLPRDAYGGVMPKSAASFVNFLGEGSELSKTLPFRERGLDMYKAISVPILVAIGDQEEYTAIPVEEALVLMQQENPRTEAHQFQNCDHDFQGVEEKLADIVLGFIRKV